MSVLSVLAAFLFADSPRPVIADSAPDVFLEAYSKSKSVWFESVLFTFGMYDSDYHLDRALVFRASETTTERDQKGDSDLYVVFFLTVGLRTSDILAIPESELIPDSVKSWEDNGYGRFTIVGERCRPQEMDECDRIDARLTIALEQGSPKVVGGAFGEFPGYKLIPEQ